MVHGAYFRPQMVTWSHILVALDVYPRPINASTECCCAFLSIVTNGFRTVVVFTIGLFLYHGSLVTDFRPCLVVWVYGVVAPSWSWWEKLEGMDWNHTQDVKCVGCLGGKWSPYMLIPGNRKTRRGYSIRGVRRHRAKYLTVPLDPLVPLFEKW
jgi:hypothetical protein